MSAKIQQAGQTARPVVVGPTPPQDAGCPAAGIDAVNQTMASPTSGRTPEGVWHATLPHEIDEHVSSQRGNRDRRVRRAYQDLRHGRVDTDGRDGLSGAWLYEMFLQ